MTVYDEDTIRHLVVDELYDKDWRIRDAHCEEYQDLSIITIVRTKR